MGVIALEWLRRIYDEAPHNAFTDLTEFKGQYFVAFRTGSDHASFDGEIRVMASKDLENWQEVAVLSTPDDDRDPHFAVFRGGLFLYFACRQKSDPEGDRTMCALSEDGRRFTKPKRIFRKSNRLWRPKALGALLYCASYEVKGRWRSLLLESKDGLSWRGVSTIHDREMANETELLPLPDGSLLALVRREAPPRTALLCRSRPPFAEWEKHDTKVVLQGPAMSFWGREIIICARFYDRGRPYTGLFALNVGRDLSRAEILHLFTLPSGGDTSYAGLLPLDEQRLLISYYSSHEGRSSIYLALLRRV